MNKKWLHVHVGTVVHCLFCGVRKSEVSKLDSGSTCYELIQYLTANIQGVPIKTKPSQPLLKKKNANIIPDKMLHI